MNGPLTRSEERRRKMAALYPRTRGPAPERYRAIARWWRLHSEETADPAECLRYADNQDRLYRDMLERPRHYRAKPMGRTDWEHFNDR